MDQISGYDLVERIHLSHAYSVYRAVRHLDSKNVAVKILSTRNASPSDVARFRQALEKIIHSNIDGIVRIYDVLEHHSGYAIIYEDIDWDSLESLIKQTGAFSLNPALTIGIHLSETLGALHNENIIHKDLRPSSVLINPETSEVKITDFGILKTITLEGRDIYNPETIKNTLAYISPEQTGRMNQAIDYRTDLYSLGVILYQLLSGRPPFRAEDPMEMLHAHIAQAPWPPEKINAEVPSVVSDIVMKLLKKNPEDRYQSGVGVMADLITCQDEYIDSGAIKPFKLAQKDVSQKFIIPRTVYGRESEIEMLTVAYDRVCQGGNELALVFGHSGIGKSTLIEEIRKPILQRKGYYLSGKFEEFRKNVPYSAIIQAFTGLIDQILAESEERIEKWNVKLAKALRNNGKYIVDLIPRLALIIGDQEALEEIEGKEERDLFIQAFKIFLTVFARKEHPLTLVLDDLQWVDMASLLLLRALIADPEVKYLLVIASYRNNEVDAAHPLTAAIEKIKKAATPITQLEVTPLGPDNINKLLSGVLRIEEKTTQPLADLIYQKTNGNPFFSKQFLKIIYQEKLLETDTGHGWKWDIEGIKKATVTENVVSFMVRKISELPPDTQETLKNASCIGNTFDLETLAMTLDVSLTETLGRLAAAIDEGVISFFGEEYRFHHDRISEAAYSLLTEEEKAKRHYKIGRYMLENIPKRERDNWILHIANHINLARTLITSDREKYKLVEINIQASNKAKRSGAFDAALSFLRKGVELLDESSWAERYDLTLQAYSEAAIAAYRAGDLDNLEVFSNEVLQHATAVLDKIRVNEIKILMHSNLNQFEEAAKIGFELLALLNITFPKEIKPHHLQSAYENLKQLLTEERLSKLSLKNKMTDPYKIAATRLMSRLFFPAMATSQPHFILNTFKCCEMSIKHGLLDISGGGLAISSSLICVLFNDIDTGYALCKRILPVFQGNRFEHAYIYLFNNCVRYWKEHLRSTLEPLLESHRSAMQMGDLQTSGICLAMFLGGFFTGMPLPEIRKKYETHAKLVLKTRFMMGIIYHQAYLQQIENFTGNHENPSDFNGDIFDETTVIPQLKQANAPIVLAMIYLHKIIAAYWFGDVEAALEYARESENYSDYIRQQYIYSALIFYDTLARIAGYSRADDEQKKQLIEKITKHQEQYKLWAEHAPMNYLHRYHLISAELDRINGKKSAGDNYDKAIAGALENEYIQEAALANELAAVYYLNAGKQTIAKAYMSEALKNLKRWGATRKIQDLLEKYPALTDTFAPEFVTSKTDGDSDYSSVVEAALDISSIVKVSQAIASEMSLDRLLERIMHFSIENAGAESGFLILENESDGRLYIEASGKIGQIDVLQSIPVDIAEGLAISIVNYVHKTNEDVVINNAPEDPKFSNEPHIINHKPQSILCIPVRHKGKTSGILYLENNLSTNAFTDERLAPLRIFSAQASISIENARLFKEINEAKEEIQNHRDHLEELVAERTLELRAAQSELVENAHRAGMADIAVGVLHNVGNVLNSAGVSTYSMRTVLKKSKNFDGLKKANALLEEKMPVIDDFISNDPKAKKLLQYYLNIGKGLEIDREILSDHLKRLQKRIEVITNIVSAQQEYASASSMSEDIDMLSIIDDALAIMAESLDVHHITVTKQFDPVPGVMAAKTKLIHVLINVFRNATDAMLKTPEDKREILIRVYEENGFVKVEAKDTGEGIERENRDKIFAHGFSTKPDGHGFGLHTCANYMVEMGGRIWTESDGPGKGSTFFLRIPIDGDEQKKSPRRE